MFTIVSRTAVVAPEDEIEFTQAVAIDLVSKLARESEKRAARFDGAHVDRGMMT